MRPPPIPIRAAPRADPGADDRRRAPWGDVDVRDAAMACRLALEAEGLGFAAVNVTAADTLVEVPTEELIRRFAPATELRRAIPGTAAAFSLDRTRRLLGYEPRHTWRAVP